MKITQAQARRFLLDYQGLNAPFQFQDKPGILDYLDRVGCIQFDPLNIVGHNSDLVLQARVEKFRPEQLKELLYEDRKLLDGWDKNMSIFRIEDWPYFERRRDAARQRSRKRDGPVQAILPEVRDAILERGPLSSLELELDEKVDWDWSESRLARAALDSMFFWGELVIHHRVHTRKFYDFAWRLLPKELFEAADPNETEARYHDWYILRRIGSFGLLWNRSGEAWLGMGLIKSRERKQALERLLEREEILEVQVGQIREPFYMRKQDEHFLEQALSLDGRQVRAVVLAPLDNLLWDRRLLGEMFGFHYRWEVYVPADQRRYGYYVLPILYGDRFIARFEPGIDKGEGILQIKNWWWEPGAVLSDEMKSGLVSCFRRFLAYLSVDRLELGHQAREQGEVGWMEEVNE